MYVALLIPEQGIEPSVHNVHAKYWGVRGLTCHIHIGVSATLVQPNNPNPLSLDVVGAVFHNAREEATGPWDGGRDREEGEDPSRAGIGL